MLLLTYHATEQYGTYFVEGGEMAMALALEGIKVVDVSQVAAVPMCARHLADFGADVIHIEHPVTGDSFRVYQAGQGGTVGISSEINYIWEAYNRNKRSMSLDLSQEGGQKIIYNLLEKADVFVTNLRLVERREFGLEYDTLHQINPKLVYSSLTGYGQKGPDKDNPAYDATAYWFRSAIPYMFSRPGMRTAGYRTAFGDNVAALALALGTMMALFARERTGVGQEVDLSLFNTGIYQLSFDIAAILATGQDPQEWEIEAYQQTLGGDEEKIKRHQELVAEAEAAAARLGDFLRENSPNPMGVPYETKDGKLLIFVIVLPERYWPRFCRAIGREDLEHDPKFNSMEARAENHLELHHIFREAFLSKTFEEWRPILADIPYAWPRNLLEVINDPQARANDFFVPIDHPTYGRMEVAANPIKLSETPASIRMPAPEFSQHTEEVLLEYGYTWEDIAQFKEQGLIA